MHCFFLLKKKLSTKPGKAASKNTPRRRFEFRASEQEKEAIKAYVWYN